MVSNVGFISFSQMALVSWRIFAGSIWFQILYATSKYSPRHQRRLGEAKKPTYRAHLFDEVSKPLNQNPLQMSTLPLKRWFKRVVTNNQITTTFSLILKFIHNIDPNPALEGIGCDKWNPTRYQITRHEYFDSVGNTCNLQCKCYMYKQIVVLVKTWSIQNLGCSMRSRAYSPNA